MDISIILNTIVFMLSYSREPEYWSNMLNNSNYFLVLIFFFEIVSKIILYRKLFFKDKFNTFELFLLFTAIVGSLWEIISSSSLENTKEISLILRLF